MIEKPVPHLTPSDAQLWGRVLEAGVTAQRLVPGSIAVGGTAAALYSGHRVSADTDHVVPALKERFDDVLHVLSTTPGWKTARLRRPVLILGSLNEVEVGYRHPRRAAPIETTAINTAYGDLVVPILSEMIGIKAFMTYDRNALRDYLDFAALTTCTTEEAVLQALLKLDEQYAGLQTGSVRLEVSKALSDAKPYDLATTDLSRYKGLAPQWHDWSRTQEICRHYGVLLGQKLTGITDATPSPEHH